MARTVVSLIRNLQRRNARRRQPLAVLEGVRLCEEALAAKVAFTGVAVSPTVGRTERGTRLLGSLRTHRVTIEEVPDETIVEISDTEAPQGIIAVVEPRMWQLDDIDVAVGRPVVILDALQDPGNVGTIVRTAFALGGAGVITLPGTVQLTHPKFLRSALGASFRFPVINADVDRVVAWSSQQTLPLWVAAADGVDSRSATLRERVGIVIGNEGSGVGQEIANAAAGRVGVRIKPEAESLNAAAAAAILLYEATR